MPTETYVATPGRLDAVLSVLSGAPRAEVQRAIASGDVRVDGAARPKAHRLAGGETLTFRRRAAEPLAADGPAVPVRFEDAHLAVIAKPAGLVTHPTAGRRTGTLVNALLGMGMRLAPAGGPLRPGIVHRLDAGTSGLLVVAKTDEAYAALQELFRRHAVVRRYLALVRGVPANEVFEVDAPLGRRAARVRVDHVEGKSAATVFEVREAFRAAALLAAAPRTGRTHQIRVHLAAAGHPILGDRAYGGAGDDARALGLRRPFLHSSSIEFVHPLTGVRLRREEPLPPDLAQALARVRRDLGP
jgi:23S rRNA pseudouridine1911/1915/1917 synthase